MARSMFVALLLASLVGPGCASQAKECESVCRRMVSGCGFTAWTSVEQCSSGCVEDMYRRDDADVVLACYMAAVEPPSRAEAEASVDDAVAHGLFEREVMTGTFDREAWVDRAVTDGTCDVFAVVQCKVDAVQVAPTGPFIE